MIAAATRFASGPPPESRGTAEGGSPVPVVDDEPLLGEPANRQGDITVEIGLDEIGQSFDLGRRSGLSSGPRPPGSSLQSAGTVLPVPAAEPVGLAARVMPIPLGAGGVIR